MREIILSFDRYLFHIINGVLVCRPLDYAMPTITDFHKISLVRFLLLPAIVLFWIWKRKKEALKVILVLGIVAGFTDLIAHRIIKPLVGRLRPPLSGIPVIVRAPYGGKLSFPSNHAANMFAAAAVLSAAYPSLTPLFYCAAVIVSYSRVYVGVHYPLDVIGGAVLGSLIAFIAIRAARKTGVFPQPESPKKV